MTVSPARSLYRLTRPLDAAPPLPDGVTLRRVAPDDDVPLGRLLERAYAGTIDEDLGDNDDGVVEMGMWRAEPGLPDLSTVAVEANDQPVSACLVSAPEQGRVWIAYVFTDPAWKDRGVGRAVVADSLAWIVAAGHAQVLAAVTDGNVPSERLVARLGFVREGPL